MNKLTEALTRLRREGLTARLQERDETLLIWAVSEGYPDIARALIAASVDLNAQNSDGNTALLRSACEGRLPLARALMDAGAALDVQNNDGYTALVLARRRENMAIADALLRAGADPQLRTRVGASFEDPGSSPKTSIQGPRDAALEAQILDEIQRATARR